MKNILANESVAQSFDNIFVLIRIAISDEESETKFCAISISFHTFSTFLDATKVEILNLTKTEHANETEVIAKPIQKWSN